MSHANLAIFVPHAGCPHRCSFCDQRGISGAQGAPEPAAVAALCAAEGARMHRFGAAEVAFFGGSFTAIDRGYMDALLLAAAPFVEDGTFRGVRVSTRPDCVEDEVLELLARRHVTAVELGAQSMDDGVLAKNGRGHTAAHVEDAARRIRARGFELGLQMMTGLYGSDPEKDLLTARRLADLGPDTVRVYPTVVLAGTRLAALWEAGDYRPQTLEEAVELGARLLRLFEEERGIPVIRMGLHAGEGLEAGLLAGPWHPAFRELCEGRLMGERAQALLRGRPPGRYTLLVAPNAVSKLTGHGALVLDGLRKMGYNIRIARSEALKGLDVSMEEV